MRTLMQRLDVKLSFEFLTTVITVDIRLAIGASTAIAVDTYIVVVTVAMLNVSGTSVIVLARFLCWFVWASASPLPILVSRVAALQPN